MKAVIAFTIALIIGREQAVFAIAAMDTPWLVVLGVTLAWYFALSYFALKVAAHPWVARKLEQASQRWLARQLRRLIPRHWINPAIFLIALVPFGFWIGAWLLVDHKVGPGQQLLVQTLGNTVSLVVYWVALSSVIVALGFIGTVVLIVSLFALGHSLGYAFRHRQFFVRRYHAAFTFIRRVALARSAA